mmetsp:Transcript_55322/g.168190  ORF Transcript_55322/g.168190 Transcript_55322/m.168190 type:complete len:256 (-) Transcript_55322:856-1623(-)
MARRSGRGEHFRLPPHFGPQRLRQGSRVLVARAEILHPHPAVVRVSLRAQRGVRRPGLGRQRVRCGLRCHAVRLARRRRNRGERRVFREVPGRQAGKPGRPPPACVGRRTARQLGVVHHPRHRAHRSLVEVVPSRLCAGGMHGRLCGELGADAGLHHGMVQARRLGRFGSFHAVRPVLGLAGRSSVFRQGQQPRRAPRLASAHGRRRRLHILDARRGPREFDRARGPIQGRGARRAQPGRRRDFQHRRRQQQRYR